MSVAVAGRSRLWVPVVVACLSLGFGGYGIAQLLSGEALGFLPGRIGALGVAVLGLVGVPAAVGHARTEWSPSAYRPLVWFTGVQVLASLVVAVAPGPSIGLRSLAFLLATGWAILGERALRSLRTP